MLHQHIWFMFTNIGNCSHANYKISMFTFRNLDFPSDLPTYRRSWINAYRKLFLHQLQDFDFQVRNVRHISPNPQITIKYIFYYINWPHKQYIILDIIFNYIFQFGLPGKCLYKSLENTCFWRRLRRHQKRDFLLIV